MRLYLIGAGVIARTHAAAAGRLGEDVELHVADPAPTVLAGFLDEFPAARGVASADEMLTATAPRDDDVVVVATPPFAHAGPATSALTSGRHVLCEKPLAMDAEQALTMLRASEDADRLLGVCSTRFRGLPHTEAVKGVLGSRALGEVYAMSFTTRWARSRAGIEYQPASRWFLDASRSGGGVVMDWGPYDMSTLFDLLDPVRVEVRDAWVGRAVTAADPAGVPFDVETDAGAALRFTRRDGAVLPVVFGRATGTHATETAHAEIWGTHGSVHWTPFDSHRPVVIRSDDDGQAVEREVAPPPRTEISIMERPLLAFVDAVRGRASAATTGRRAVAEFLVLQAIYQAARTGTPQTVEVGA